MDLHDLVAKLKALAIDMQKTPTKTEFLSENPKTNYTLNKLGGYAKLLAAAGMDTYHTSPQVGADIKKALYKYQALCKKREQIQGFFRNVLDLDEIFKRAGNPASIKLSAQPDTHAKFADMKAWRCYLEFLKYFNPDIHLILGDFVDCEGLSHWPDQDLEPRRIVPEMKIGRGMLGEVVAATPNATTRLYLEGNHERWIMMALANMPELFDGLAELDIEISLKTLLNLDKFGYELFPMNELVQIGKAHFTHGIYTTSNHAKKHLDVFKCNIYYGHLHDTQESNQTSVDGPMEAASLGCLCRLDAKFLKGKPNNWAHAHGVFEFFPDGSYTFYKLRIIDGRMSFNGKIFTG